MEIWNITNNTSLPTAGQPKTQVV